MELKLHLIRTALLLTALVAHGQGVFFYDQQSSTNQSVLTGGGSVPDQSPFGQSFTPQTSSMNFIRLGVYDTAPGNGLGATLHLNLRADGIDGSILATTPSLAFGNGYVSFVDFFFAGDLPLSPGNLYVFEIVAEPGSDRWGVTTAGENNNYVGGMLFANGIPSPGANDLWFREGTYVVPEPSALAIVLLGAGALAWSRRAWRGC